MINVECRRVRIRDLVNGFSDQGNEGIFGYGGLLNIRPPYQREFIYKEKQEKAVIDSVFKGFPLNGMYWAENDNGNYELIDGQQRTLSICHFYKGTFFVIKDNSLVGFYNLNQNDKDKFLDYELQVYICKNASYKEKIEWFNVINTVGEKLTAQELRNAIYSGPWVYDARFRFASSPQIVSTAMRYLTGSAIRQDYLETVLKWKSNGEIDEYMAKHQHDANADIEVQYFKSVTNWIETLFPKYRSIMKGLDWGSLYERYKDLSITATELENKLSNLLIDDDVTRKKGVYEYVLSGEEKHLNLRAFSDAMKIATYEKQKGICAKCGKSFVLEEMEADHIIPWSKGGHTTSDNCQMLCKNCNRTKSDI